MQEKWLRLILGTLLRCLFRLELRGFEHYARTSERTLIIANHQSFLDPLLLAVFLPRKPAFVMNVFQAEKWYFRWVKKIVKVYAIDPSQPMSMKSLIGDLRKGAHVVIFPEGRITTSGGIMKIYEGAAVIAAKSGADLLPVHVEGALYSKLSKMHGKQPLRWFPRVRLTMFPPIPTDAAHPPTARTIYDVLTHNSYAAQDVARPVLAAILEAKGRYGRRRVVATDLTRQSMSYQSLMVRSLIVSAKLEKHLAGQRYVAMLLPNSLAAVVTFTALQAMNKVPCMLNFSAGTTPIMHACRVASVRTVLTSRAFVEKGGLQALIEALSREYVVVYLEDVRASVGLVDKLSAAVKSHVLPWVWRRALAARPYDPAVVLYTSGSEGAPKGVALSHVNLLANLYQAAARFDLQSSDRLFNALPVFHSFGLTIGTLLPLVRGIEVFMYPSPLHYRVIPELIYDTDSTIMVGTDTFYQGYAHYAHPYDFRAIRLAVAGAEKLKESTRRLYADRFGVSIMQGYGVTETSPVIACNTHINHREGTVGRIFPGMEWRLEPVEGINEGGRLLIKGANVMLGYLKADAPGVVQPVGDWHDTGDIVSVDEEGFFSIRGRAKRFAKIGGEMVSLAAVEEFVSSVAPEQMHAALALPDERKGEQVVVVTTATDVTRPRLVSAAREAGFPEIAVPRQVIAVEAIPLLGSGKIDYVQLKANFSSAEPTA